MPDSKAMKPRAVCKIGVDIAMTVLFLMQMGYHMMDNRMHEWTGVALCLLFLGHHALNGGWHRGLLRGRYTPQRVLLTAVDVLLTLAMAAVIVSAVLVSRHVFDFLGLRMRALGRRIHMPATMWAFVLCGLHIGLHWNRMLGVARRTAKGRGARAGVWLARLLLLAVAVYGAAQFISRGLYMELLMLREFAFLEYGEALWVFFASYAAVLILWGAVAYYLNRLLIYLSARRRRKTA